MADVRADIVKWAMWAVQNKKRFHYLQARPFTYRLTAPINIDCSGFVGWCYKQAGAFDPYQRQHSGIGYTGTLIELGKKLIIPRLQVKPGDIVVYSVDRPTSEQHTAVVVAGGKDPLTVSMGQEGDPSLVHVSQDPRKPTFYRFPTGQAWPATPFPPK
jgi:cell wall-associated NlpC family hydrolase